jgi:hypothetical protein
MDVLAVKQACKFAKDHVLENGPIVSISEITLIFSHMDAYVGAYNSSRTGLGWTSGIHY